jgi:hypothetical protein
MQDQQEGRVEQTTVGCLFGNRIQLIEFSVVVDLEVVGCSLDKEGIVELKLQSSVAGMSNRMVSSKFNNISAIV